MLPYYGNAFLIRPSYFQGQFLQMEQLREAFVTMPTILIRFRILAGNLNSGEQPQ